MRLVLPEGPEEPAAWRARVSACRPMETILFERSLPDGVAAITTIVDRRTGELAFVGEVKGLSPSEAEELRGLARSGSTEGLAPLEIEHARLRLARAILASRIAGRTIPAWLMERADLIGDPCHPASRVDDVYLCADCDGAMPPEEQLARAHGAHAAPLICPTCRGEHTPRTTPADGWLARAWLMLAADLPHRALVCAARAEAARAPQARLDIVRGLSHLRLEQGAQALACFARVANIYQSQGVERDPRLAQWLARAEQLVRTTPVRSAHDRDRTVPSPVPGHGSSRVVAPVPALA